MVAVNDVGCALVLDEYDLDGLGKAVQSLNVALRVRTHCARILVSRRGAPLPSICSVIEALAEAGIGVIHLAAASGELCVLVDEQDAARAQIALAGCADATPRTAA
jgi:hypothetical protein